MTTLPLTIIILTNRSDKHFIASLESAQIAEEILIVDHDSGNDWKRLADKYKFSIVKKVETITDFAQLRNEASAYAREDWILFLDSDEILSEENYPILEQCIADKTTDGWYLKRQDYFYDKPLLFGETGNNTLLRLFQKGKGHFSRKVHETCTVNGSVKNSPLSLKHYSHPSIHEFLASISIYAELVATNVKHESKQVILTKMLTYPVLKFISNFFLKQGFRDGYRGFIYALLMSFHSFFVRVYQYEHAAHS